MKFSIPTSLPPAWVFQELSSPFWSPFPATNLSRSNTPELPALQRDRFYPEEGNRELQMLISAGHPGVSRCFWTCWGWKFSLSSWHESLSPSHTESIALLRDTEWSGLRFGRKNSGTWKTQPLFCSSTAMPAQTRDLRKCSSRIMRIIWGHKTLTLLLHYQMAKKNFLHT